MYKQLCSYKSVVLNYQQIIVSASSFKVCFQNDLVIVALRINGPVFTSVVCQWWKDLYYVIIHLGMVS